MRFDTVSLEEIEESLVEDGYGSHEESALLAELARDVRRADQSGCLLWTAGRLTSTQTGNRFDLRPVR